MKTPEIESIPDILDQQREEQEFLARWRAHRESIEGRSPAMRDVLKKMRFALNAFNDGCPELACEILGDALRQYGEEQP